VYIIANCKLNRCISSIVFLFCTFNPGNLGQKSLVFRQNNRLLACNE
jgi:hypothetical protein